MCILDELVRRNNLYEVSFKEEKKEKKLKKITKAKELFKEWVNWEFNRK